MKTQHVVEALRKIAPLEYAEAWDRVGLLAGRASRELRGPVLLTIDLTEAVLDEAAALGASMIVAYHPVIWEPLSRLTEATPRERLILRCLELEIAVYCPHTALDAAPGGINDWLCEAIAGAPAHDVQRESLSEGVIRIAGDCRALKPRAALPSTQQVKLVTFVPADQVELVRSSLATAGAGIIGGYQACSFSAPGVGTFFGGEGTHPTTGSAGRLEKVDEVRLEMVCGRSALPLAIETLRRFHPYEEAAIDVYPLEPLPTRSIGLGRRLALDKPATIATIAARLKTTLGCRKVQYAGVHEDKPVTFVGVCAGSGSELAGVARDEGCEVYVTGELKHHETLAVLNSGMGVIVAGHTNTERGYLPRLAARLSILSPGIDVRVSKADVDPLLVV
ncbi:MAG: Nif3-like dinuclear metal center hexameric protein [Planctomycetota bacterium]|nr:Nif3-like dinuclear metal center hexameric protein [Planctomycetota bacterium]